MKAKKTTATCQECGKRFVKGRAWAKWCSGKCAQRNWIRTHPRIAQAELDKLQGKPE